MTDAQFTQLITFGGVLVAAVPTWIVAYGALQQSRRNAVLAEQAATAAATAASTAAAVAVQATDKAAAIAVAATKQAAAAAATVADKAEKASAAIAETTGAIALKTVEISQKADEIHLLTNSNLTAVKSDLAIANEQIRALQNAITRIVDAGKAPAVLVDAGTPAVLVVGEASPDAGTATIPDVAGRDALRS